MVTSQQKFRRQKAADSLPPHPSPTVNPLLKSNQFLLFLSLALWKYECYA